MEPKLDYDPLPRIIRAAIENTGTTADHSGVISEIVARCAKNDEQWGGHEHDDRHLPEDWVQFIDHQIFEIEAGDRKFRDRMIKIASLVIQAVESYDRKYVEPNDAR